MLARRSLIRSCARLLVRFFVRSFVVRSVALSPFVVLSFVRSFNLFVCYFLVRVIVRYALIALFSAIPYQQLY